MRRGSQTPLAVLLALILVLVVAGCGRGGDATPAAGPLGSYDDASFARQLAGPSTYLGQMPTAIVLLKPGNTGRDVAFCRAFARLPTAEAAMAASVIAPNVVATRWPVTASSATVPQATDCAGFLVPNYDYDRAAAIMSRIRLNRGNFDGVGPYMALLDGTRVVVVDGSSFTSAGFNGFIAKWSQALAQGQVRADADAPGGLAGAIWNYIRGILIAVFPSASVILGSVA